MTDEERERQMEFLLNQQAVFHSELIDLKGVVAQTSQNVNNLANRLDMLAVKVETLADTVQQHAEMAELNRQEMRDAVSNLIITNEVTREFANNIARLVVNVSQRLTAHERDHGPNQDSHEDKQ